METESFRRTTIKLTSDEVLQIVKAKVEAETGLDMKDVKILYTEKGRPEYGLDAVGMELAIEED